MRSLFTVAILALAVPFVTAAPVRAAEDSISIVAHNFAFAPATVKLERGETYTLHLTSTDGAHGLNVPELGIRNVMITSHPQTITITPKTAGTFVAHCSQYCGSGHATMAMTFVVSTPAKSEKSEKPGKSRKAGNPCGAPSS